MKPHRILYLLVMFSILLSCETEIPFDGTVSDPVLVLNGMACTDSIVRVEVTVSRFFLDNEGTFPVVTNATVNLSVNGVFKERMQHVGQGLYQSQHRPAEGEILRLDVEAPGYGPVWTETTFPVATWNLQIDSTITKKATDSTGTTFSLVHDFQISFSDPAAEANYYRLVAYHSTTIGDMTNNTYLNEFDDVVFGTKNDEMDGIFTESSYDRYNIFSDELIDGKTHTITFKYEQGVDPYGNRPIPGDSSIPYVNSLTFNLQSISKSYYLYLHSLKALEMSDPFMSEPVQIYSNIQGGLGILGAWTNKQRSFVLPKTGITGVIGKNPSSKRSIPTPGHL